MFVAVLDKSSSSSLLVALGLIVNDLTVSWDPVVESDGSSSSILFSVSGGSTESKVSCKSALIESNPGPLNSSKSSSGVSGVGGGDEARPDPAAQWSLVWYDWSKRIGGGHRRRQNK